MHLQIILKFEHNLKLNTMKKNTILTFATIIFLAVAVLHLLRYILGWELTLNNYSFPQWGSILSVIITASLAYHLHKLKN